MLKKLLFILKARILRGSRVSPLTYVKHPQRIVMGRRCKIHSGASIDGGRGGVSLGDGVTLNRYAYVQGAAAGVRLGNGVEINNFSVINGTGGVDIGNDVIMGPHVRVISYQHSFDDINVPIKRQPLKGARIVIGDDVWLGAGAIVLAGLEIGRGSVVGAGAVVTRSCPPYSVLAGVPARVIRQRGA
jgi:carbonic anhydrase/acetyltransferase-like protein (isoleucine patch superfamily)